MAERTDEQLAAEAASGDQAAFDRLVLKHRPALLAFCRALMPTEAEDRVQEAFLKAFQNLDRFDASRSFSSWLYKIAQNSCFDALRKRGPADSAVPEPSAAAPLTFEHADQLDAAIGNLPAKYRAILHFKYRVGLNATEIADQLGYSKEDVRVSLHRAIRILREGMQS